MVPAVRWESMAIAGLCVLAGCGGDECVYDTDCPLFMRCDMGSCQVLGGRDAGPDAGPRRDGGGTDGGGSDAGVDPLATFSANVVRSPGGVSHSVSGSVFAMPVATPGCTRTTSGPCTIESCTAAPPTDAGTFDAGMPAYPSAGHLTVTGAATVEVDPTMGQYFVFGTGELYVEGGAVTFTAAGAEVPAFSQMVNAPSFLTVSAPDVAAPLAIPRATDLALTWSSAPSATDVIVQLSGMDAAGRATVTCSYDSSTASVTVPSAALMAIPAGTGTISISTTAVATTRAGAWQIEVRAGFTAISDEGTPFSTSTMFE
jgi:hypothetical protein